MTQRRNNNKNTLVKRVGPKKLGKIEQLHNYSLIPVQTKLNAKKIHTKLD